MSPSIDTTSVQPAPNAKADLMTGTSIPPAPSIIAGLMTLAQIAADLDRSERTILRFDAQGIPVIRVGTLRLYDPAAVREWLLSQQSRRTTPKRGRPSKRAA